MTKLHSSLDDFRLQDFEPRYAPLIASWAPTRRELFLLAPATSPPLTPEKVVQWTTERDNPLLLWRRDETAPVGYGELNRTIRDRDDLWIGHLIVPRELQGQGIGYAFVQHLLHRAFLDCEAKRVSLVVFPENEVAVNCYLKCGLAKERSHLKTFDHTPGRYRMLKMSLTQRKYRRYCERVRPPGKRRPPIL